MARTRIVATLGPASSSELTIRALIEAGVDLFRLNLAHGTRQEHAQRIAAIRRAAAGRPVAILADLAGPKLRLDRPVRAQPGDIVALPLPPRVRPGDPVLLADGAMLLEVVGPDRCRAITGGEVPRGKGMNFPASALDVPAITAKDRDDLAWARQQGVDYVAVSFVRRARDLDEPRAAGIPVVAKIETSQAVEDAPQILANCDALMVARGDLGVEIPLERVPVVQKELIARANQAAIPVITATQMLRSMVDQPVPTRAEAADVANAVLDGTDAVMLSEETAVGHHPVEAVRTMERLLRQAETILEPRRHEVGPGPVAAIAHAAVQIAGRIGAAAIVVPTQSGFSARQVARWRPLVPILALVASEEVQRRLALVWGLRTILTPWFREGQQDPLAHIREALKAAGILPAGARVVVLAGWPLPQPGVTNLLHIAEI